jgi:hypothetical protein
MYDSLTQSPSYFFLFGKRIKIFNSKSLVFGFNFFQISFPVTTRELDLFSGSYQ